MVFGAGIAPSVLVWTVWFSGGASPPRFPPSTFQLHKTSGSGACVWELKSDEGAPPPGHPGCTVERQQHLLPGALRAKPDGVFFHASNQAAQIDDAGDRRGEGQDVELEFEGGVVEPVQEHGDELDADHGDEELVPAAI